MSYEEKKINDHWERVKIYGGNAVRAFFTNRAEMTSDHFSVSYFSFF